MHFAVGGTSLCNRKTTWMNKHVYSFFPLEGKMLEPQENGLIDLPDYERIEDETFPPFPPPASPERDGEGAEPGEGLYRVPKWYPCSAIHLSA